MKLQYYSSAILAFLIWGMFSLVLKPLSHYPSIDILLYRIAFASIVILVVSFLFRRKITKDNIQRLRVLQPKQRGTFVVCIFVSAVMLAMNWFLFIYAMNNISVNSTSLAYLICPILTTLLASVFLKEELNIGQWCAVGLSILSCVMLSYGHFLDTFYSFIIALSYAVYLILQKYMKGFDKFFVLSLEIILCTIMLLPLISLMPDGVVLGNDFYIYVFLIAVVFTIVPLFLNGYALKGLESSVVGILLYLNPIISFLIAIFYFKESINSVQVVAYALIFIAVVIFNLAYIQKLRHQKNVSAQDF